MKTAEILSALKKNRLLITFAGIFLSYRLIISPYISNYKQNKLEIKNLESKLLKALPLLAEEETVNSLYTALREIIPVQTTTERIDWDKLSSEVYNVLSTLANKYNVKILNYRPRLEQLKKSVSPENSEEKKKSSPRTKTTGRSFKPMEIDLDIEAGLADFMRFVYALEYSPQLTAVEEAVLTAAGKKGISIKIKVKKIIF
ncbi:MAG: hypothetical protein NC898_04485 [Candidatus Omnitrophica bacterium]|nr:hypothetical protein [Candidatus Omnitrophota bacterium]MCM8793704.1 hypothetical protein [Candidatus Omnitrophota bacterium]